jgi:poly(beta-D-mannuronate) lyase
VTSHLANNSGRSRRRPWRLALLPALASTLPAACPPPGQPDIRALGYYTDKAGSVIDPVLHQQNKDATAPLDRYAADVARMSDDYLRTGDRAAAQCTLAWLGAWADDGAMLGQMIRVNNNQSFYMRQWMLDAVAMAYLKVHDQADARQRARIDPWLQSWPGPTWRTGTIRNGAATTTTTGAVWACWPPAWPPTTMPWQAGHAAFQKGVDDIQDDGSLPLEMGAGNAPCTTTTTRWRRW